MFVATLPATKLDRRNRVSGHIYLKLDAQGREYLDGVARKFKDRGVSRVVVADIHARSGHYLAQLLDVPCKAEKNLRGFNFGKFNGHQVTEVSKIVNDVVKHWDKDEGVPVVGGDSWTSYRRRFIQNVVKLAEADDNALFLGLPMDITVLRNALAKRAGQPYRGLLSAYFLEGKGMGEMFKLKLKPVEIPLISTSV